MSPRYLILVSVSACALIVDVAVGQQITVQQPVFSRFSVATTVSVPDRGSALLGGISRAGDSRTSFGPFPSGQSVGGFREHAGVTAHAWIHDFAEMDRLLLEEGARASAAANAPRLAGNAEPAYQSLLARHAGGAERGLSHQRGADADQSAAERPSSAFDEPAFPHRRQAEAASSEPSEIARCASADKFYRLGQQALDQGKPEVARVHFRLAARNGSSAAETALRQLEPPAFAANQRGTTTKPRAK
jgi:hypothetical protein